VHMLLPSLLLHAAVVALGARVSLPGDYRNCALAAAANTAGITLCCRHTGKAAANGSCPTTTTSSSSRKQEAEEFWDHALPFAVHADLSFWVP
jgi:hypothetical protein